jgi:mycoredoxin
LEETNETLIIVYGHPTCPGVGPVKLMLQQAKIPYTYVDIHQDNAARERVRQINNGYESVPTLVFPDGSTLTEPSGQALGNKLKAIGYRVPLQALIAGNLWLIVIVAAILFALLRAFNVF